MYLRFVVSEIDQDSERSLGIFHAVAELRDSGRLSEEEFEEVQSIRAWFNDHLEKPERFSRTKVAYRSNKRRGLSWFKPTAHQHIFYARRYSSILERYGVAVRTLKTKCVGFILYEDEFQIVGEPFSDIDC